MRARTTLNYWIIVLGLGLVIIGAGATEVHADTTIGAATEESQTTPHGASGPGGPCGGIIGYFCDEGLVCVYEAGVCIGFDILGVCVEHPCPSTYEPVCGCDGVTYDNTCLAHQLGTNPYVTDGRVDYEGVCTTNVPAVSDTGTGVLIFLLLAAGTTLLVYRRRHPPVMPTRWYW